DGWKSYFFFVLGHRIDESYDRCPETGKLLDSIPGLSLAFFSVLGPGMHIKTHRGSYKGVVRCHLGLIVPEPRTDVRMRVGDKMIYWEEGKCVIFDDTHKHEVWNMNFEFNSPNTRIGRSRRRVVEATYSFSEVVPEIWTEG